MTWIGLENSNPGPMQGFGLEAVLTACLVAGPRVICPSVVCFSPSMAGKCPSFFFSYQKAGLLASEVSGFTGVAPTKPPHAQRMVLGCLDPAKCVV